MSSQLFKLKPLFKRGWILALVSVFCLLALNACNPSNFKTQAAQVSQLVYGITAEPKTFNVVLSKESPNVFSATYEGMLAEDGVTTELKPALAESWKDEGQKITFTLRKDLKWSDGKPLTADDVVFSFNEVFINEKIPTSIRDSLSIGKSRLFPKVSKISDRVIEVTSPEAFAPLLRTVGGLPILPKHALESTLKNKDASGNLQFLSTWDTGTDPKKIVCNGPFVLDSYKTSERVVFKRNPYYWRRDAQGQQLPYLERMVWQIVENPDTLLMQFRSGGLDMLEVAPRNFSLLKKEEKRGNFTIYEGGADQVAIYISFNQNTGSRDGKPFVNPIKSRWFKTKEFRQAIAYAIDRPSMLTNVYRGIGQLQYSEVYTDSPYYLSPKQGLKTYEYNPERARQLLLKSGFKYDQKNQLSDSLGNRVRFSLMAATGSRTGEIVASQMKLDLAKIGIQMDFQQLDFGSIGEKISTTFDWEAHFGAVGGGGIDPNGAANFWAVNGEYRPFNQAPTAGQPPVQGRIIEPWEEEIARLYVEGAQELDTNKRKEIYWQAGRIGAEQLPYIYLFNPTPLAAIRNKVKNVKYSAYGGLLWNLYELKVADK
ncbi:ABC transporter substrate-binding protein [Brunnivagina elsteri]|uniref:Peptide ABC transporter substrate-binding protein n=1 Tax=Brunnivagina elsteri CCALA 953 TaxID=987040 RepID=A0A2A2TA35_9CYAN|nr:ABC transporter substrate-binding protein [Calothrix elsteri]PAX45811.1 peptide ABC transporter substrate-binding protein [Calothrix elsteri CCALA 953]